jgi:hypothetical protein
VAKVGTSNPISLKGCSAYFENNNNNNNNGYNNIYITG